MPTLNRHRLGVLTGSALLAGATYAAVSNAGGLTQSFDSLSRASLVWVLAALVGEMISFVATGAVLHRLLPSEAGVTPSTAVGVIMVVNGFGSVMPVSPAEGLLVGSAELRARGVPNHDIAVALSLTRWSTTRALYGFVAVDALAFALLGVLRHPLPTIARAGIVAGATVTLALLVISARALRRPRTVESIAVVIGALVFWHPRASVAQRRARGAQWHADVIGMIGGPQRRFVTGLWSLVSTAGDAACFGLCLQAAGARPQPVFFLFVYGVANLTTLIPFLPAGLGAMEAVVPVVLRRGGVRLSRGLTGILAFRVVGLLLPALAGVAAMAALRFHRPHEQPISTDRSAGTPLGP